MAIPSYEQLMLPVLKNLEKNNQLAKNQLCDLVSSQLGLTEEEINQMYPTKSTKIFRDRIGWALTYLKKAGLVDFPERGIYKITNDGILILKSNPQEIDNKYIVKFFKNSNNSEIEHNDIQINDNVIQKQTPDEMLNHAQELYMDNLKSELLAKLKSVDPVQFERIVLILMEKMNYGVGSMTPTSHDGGIDGIIDEDELGLEKIYLQAKRYSDNKVNEKEMQNFAGALGCSPVRKGVFITTSYFDERAKRKADSIQGKVIRLVDGEELTRLMIKHNIGVQTKTKIEIKKLDEDFFNDEE